MIRYYASTLGRPFTSDRGPQYFAWNEDTSTGNWVSAINGRWLSDSGFRPSMSIMKHWVIVEAFHPEYLELDEGL